MPLSKFAFYIQICFQHQTYLYYISEPIDNDMTKSDDSALFC